MSIKLDKSKADLHAEHESFVTGHEMDNEF